METEFLGQPFHIERIGTDGDAERLKQLIRQLDGNADAIGLGGTNLYLSAGKRRYVVRTSAQLVAEARFTPVTDGYGVKRYIEPKLVRYLDEQTQFKLRGRRVLHVCGVDRWGMAEAMVRAGARVVFGDVMFALGLPVPIPSIRVLYCLAVLLLPVISRLSTEQVGYPTGTGQELTRSRYERFYRWADFITGDFLFIRKHLPEDLSGKVVITNTVTSEDAEELRRRGVRAFITASPRLQGRTFGTNVIDGVMIALSGKRALELTEADYLEFARRLNWRPHIEMLD
ncbi:MAG: quinate 5-dehydrogenase [Armatimonadota bacterium]